MRMRRSVMMGPSSSIISPAGTAHKAGQCRPPLFLDQSPKRKRGHPRAVTPLCGNRYYFGKFGGEVKLAAYMAGRRHADDPYIRPIGAMTPNTSPRLLPLTALLPCERTTEPKFCES